VTIEEVAGSVASGCLVCELKKEEGYAGLMVCVVLLLWFCCDLGCWSDGLCCCFGSAVILGGGSPT
jgi:hypothetical protein